MISVLLVDCGQLSSLGGAPEDPTGPGPNPFPANLPPQEGACRMTARPDPFRLAADGDTDGLRALLSAEPALANARSPEGTLLYWAAMHGHNARSSNRKPVVDLLIAHGADLDIFAAAYLDLPDRAADLLAADPTLAHAVDARGWTALHHAAERGAPEVARLLLEAGADPNARDPRGHTPLHHAAHPGPWKPAAAVEVIALLRQKGALEDIFLAASMGGLERLRDLLRQDGGLVEARDAEGATPLFSAAHNLHLEACRLLVEHGADVNATRTDGQTPVSTAVLHLWDRGGPEVVAFLRGAGAALGLDDAAKLGDGDRIRELLAADPTRPTDTALRAAAQFGQTAAGLALVEAGAHLDLHTAAGLGLTDAVARFLDREPALIHAARPSDGWTPLIAAAAAAQAETVELLLRRGAAVDARSTWGSTALHLVCGIFGRGRRPGEIPAAEALLHAGADVNAKDRDGLTPLAYAQYWGSEGVATLLRAHGGR